MQHLALWPFIEQYLQYILERIVAVACLVGRGLVDALVQQTVGHLEGDTRREVARHGVMGREMARDVTMTPCLLAPEHPTPTQPSGAPGSQAHQTAAEAPSGRATQRQRLRCPRPEGVSAAPPRRRLRRAAAAYCSMALMSAGELTPCCSE